MVSGRGSHCLAEESLARLNISCRCFWQAEEDGRVAGQKEETEQNEALVRVVGRVHLAAFIL